MEPSAPTDPSPLRARAAAAAREQADVLAEALRQAPTPAAAQEHAVSELRRAIEELWALRHALHAARERGLTVRFEENEVSATTGFFVECEGAGCGASANAFVALLEEIDRQR